MDGGLEQEIIVMVNLVQVTVTVKTLVAMEVSALTRLLLAMHTGSLNLTGVMICPVTEMINAKVEFVQMAHAVIMAIIAVYRRLVKQIGVLSIYATMRMISVEMNWLAWVKPEQDSRVLILIRTLSPSTTLV